MKKGKFSGFNFKDEMKKQARFWSEFGWAEVVGEDRNIDQIPAELDVDFACPECESVWVEIDAYGLIPPRARVHLVTYFSDGPLIGFDRPTGLLAPRAICLVCASGHRIEYDKPTGYTRLKPLLSWAATALLGSVIVAAYAFPILASMKVKGNNR